jgi:protein-disulfide isomerase
MSTLRRPLALALLACAALAAAGLGALAWKAARPLPPLAFVARAAPEGFRDLVLADRAAAASAAVLPPPAAQPGAAAPGDLCRALFADPDDPRLGDGPTVAVYFTDYRCPYCRVLGALLRDRAEAGQITLIVKEWPILGPPSEAAARMALAAARQGAWLPAHERLTHTPFVPNAAYVAELARGLGLDPGRMAADLDDPAIAAHLARTAALARALGFGGSPGLVVGRTVAKRSVREPLLDRLIAEERALGPVPC